MALAIALLLLPAAGGLAQPLEQQAAPPPPQEAPPEYGAIAFTADGSYSATWRRPTKAAAENKVRGECTKFGRGDCKVVSFRQELCAAIASFRTAKELKVTYAGGGVTRADAERAAMERCNRDGRARGRCQMRTVACGDGRHRQR
jgi:hypothetical protein